MDEERLLTMDEMDAEASALHYSIAVQTLNYKLNNGQRKAIREMMHQMLVQTRIKMALVMDNPDLYQVRGEIRSPVTGKRPFTEAKTDTNE
jgi:lipopolysaccharide biosynthesis regulator YciM